MPSQKKSEITRKYGKAAKRNKRIPKSIRVGAKRSSVKNQFQCKKCGKFFPGLKEINLHYSAANHQRAKPKRKSIYVREFHEFSKEQQQQAVAIANALFDKRRFQEEMKKRIREKFGDVRRY